MNRLTIIGNLCSDPQLRTTTSGKQVCQFTVAVNRRRTQDGQQEADFFRVSAWRELGVNCSKFLQKGRKVCVIGPVSVRTYQRNDGGAGASMEVQAQDVEFLSPKASEIMDQIEQGNAQPGGFTPVEPGDDLPF